MKGPGGHTARPHRTVDVVHVIAKLATDLPAGLAKLSDSRDAVNLTFGAIEAGDASNVIPTDARLRGSLRAAGRASWEQAGPRLRTLIAAIAEPFGATWELDHLIGAPPIVNDPWAVDGHAGRGAGRACPGATLVPTVQSGGGEDFSWFLDRVPRRLRPPGGPHARRAGRRHPRRAPSTWTSGRSRSAPVCSRARPWPRSPRLSV